MKFQLLSLLPPTIAILVALKLKKIIPALFLGVFIGAVIKVGGNPFLALLKTFDEYIIPSLASKWNATVVIYGSFFGGFMSMLKKTGGAYALGEYLGKKAKNKKRVELSTAFLGLLIFFDDYFNCLTVGSVMRPLSDKMKIAREKLAYIIDSTAAPVCLLVPISTWVVYVIGILGVELTERGEDISPFVLYLKTIPYNMYAIFSLLFVFVMILFPHLGFGPMKKAEKRAHEKGQVARIDADLPVFDEKEEITFHHSPKVKNLFIPLFFMIFFLLLLFLYTGAYFSSTKSLMAAIGSSNGAFSILVSVFIAGMIALVMGTMQKIFSLGEGVDFFLDGMRGMIATYVLLILAWSMGALMKDMGTAYFVGSILKSSLPKVLIPSLIFLVGGIISFTTGTAYGTYAMIIPICFELKAQMGIPYELIVSAALSGGIFGDHCSPLSDTTILSSAGASCDHLDHVMTQLPYALLMGIFTFIFYFIVMLVI